MRCPRLLLLSLIVLLAAISGACKGGDPVKCEQACRNYAQLQFWATAEVAIAAAPVKDRDALRTAKLTEFTRQLELGIDMCATHCISANSDDQVACMIDAKTAAQAKACAKD